MKRSLRSERGASPATMLILIPIIMMIVELIMLSGRVTAARADLATAAREGARTASIAQTASQARTEGAEAVQTVLTTDGVPCTSAPASVDVSDFANPTEGRQVVVEAKCTVKLSDLGFLGLPGSVVLTSVAVEPVDFWRVVE